MKCPYCSKEESHVVDSREVEDEVRRRRECLACGARFTTSERIMTKGLWVIKKDDRREEYQREKLLTGIRKACEKRPLPAGTIEKTVDGIEAELFSLGRREVPTTIIGDMVMARLKQLDHIAYIRFASVYRPFADLASLKQEVDTLAQAPTQLALLPNASPPHRLRRRRA